MAHTRPHLSCRSLRAPGPGATARSWARLALATVALAGTALLVGAVGAAASAQTVTTVTTPTSGTPGDQLSGVACPTATDCIAVGTAYSKTAQSAIAEQWSGATWAVDTVPSPSGQTGGSLSAIACPSSTECFAVGMTSDEWKGGSWSILALPAPSGTTAFFSGIACPAATECFAVGGAYEVSGTSFSQAVLVDEWNAGTWSTVSSVPQPGSSGAISALSGIACPAAAECLAVGSSQASATSTPTSIADKWTGSSWAALTVSGQGFQAVGCATATACFLAGPPSVEWNGSAFTALTFPGTTPHFYGIDCPSTTLCYAAGVGQGTAGTPSTLLDTWDGTAWSTIPTPNGAGPINSLFGVACPSSTQCFAVGSSTNCTSTSVGGTLVLSITTPQVSPSALSQYTPVTPSRICDTRTGNPSGLTGGAAQCDGKHLAAGTSAGTLVVQVANLATVPAGATGVIVNVTVTGPTATGYLTAWPDGPARPLASNLNFSAGETIANLVQVALGSNGKLDIFNSAGTADVIVDVEGYFTTSTAESYSALSSPARLADTRCAATPTPTFCSGEKIPSANASLATLAPKGSIAVQTTGVDGVPASGVGAVVLNVTSTSTSSSGYLTVWPAGGTRPTASNLNWPAGVTIPNRVVVPVGSGGKVDVYNANGSTNVIVDVAGYYSTSGNEYASTSPVRLLDTRSGKALGPAGSESLKIEGVDGIPSSGVTAVVLNVTVTGTTASGWLAVYPTGDALPAVSDLNWSKGETIPNLVVVGVGSGASVTFYNAAGSTNVIADVEGWYQAPATGSPASALGSAGAAASAIPVVSVVTTPTSAKLSPHC